MNQTARDGRIELLRFLSCLMILCFHATLLYWKERTLFQYAYILVELFFCISGYFAMLHFRRSDPALYRGHEARTALAYTVRRMVPLWVCSFSVVFLRMLWKWLISGRSVLYLFQLLVVRFPEASLLNAFLPAADYCTPPLWYAAALLAALPLFIYLLLRFSDAFSRLLVWMLPLFIYGYYIGNYGTVQNVYFFIPAILRALAGLCLGGCVCCASEWLKTCKPTRFLRLLLTLAAVIGIAAAVLLCAGRSGRHDGAVILLLILSLSALLCNQSYIRPFTSRACNFLGAITLPLYMTQYLAFELVTTYFSPLAYWPRVLCVLGLSLLFSLLLYGLLALVCRINWKKLFVLPESAA